MIRALVLLLFTGVAHAGPYLELGINAVVDNTCIRDGSYGCSDDPLGSIGVGYQWDRLSLELEHLSSLHETDKGLNLLRLRYRIGDR